MARQSELPTIELQARGDVPDSAIDYARKRVAATTRLAPEPILFIRVRLTLHGNPAAERPAVAQANVDLNGRLVRVQAVAETTQEAIDEMAERLRMRYERVARHWEARRGAQPRTAPHEWRHLSTPADREPYFRRPPEEREVVARKTYAIESATPDEAIWDMELLDYDFFLFTDADSGEDSLVERVDDDYAITPGSSAPRLDLAEAIDRLEMTGSRHVFFIDAESGRGAVVYHRYDGHYGLIVAT